ncbi:hypothetical protein HMPREF0168_0274 [Bifidobacterium dentium ATCC 27679]|uniref:Uncharacterized protein n=1 Tax=Bifidobacterium dentium ATCC 27679 TaxID=871562 RepID=E0Q567_9BIFI|nr:hypothetical protein HMPREF0168_0274 [Bifidobacterium dentium ATCC 27679]
MLADDVLSGEPTAVLNEVLSITAQEYAVLMVSGMVVQSPQ